MIEQIKLRSQTSTEYEFEINMTQKFEWPKGYRGCNISRNILIDFICYRGNIASIIFVYLVDTVFCRRKQDRWLGEIAHGVELGPLAGRMIQLVNFFSSRCCHFTFGSSSLFIPSFSFGSLRNEKKKKHN